MRAKRYAITIRAELEAIHYDTFALADLEREEREKDEREANDALARVLSTMSTDDPDYWDVYKWVYGVRTRWLVNKIRG